MADATNYLNEARDHGQAAIGMGGIRGAKEVRMHPVNRVHPVFLPDAMMISDSNTSKIVLKLTRFELELLSKYVAARTFLNQRHPWS